MSFPFSLFQIKKKIPAKTTFFVVQRKRLSVFMAAIVLPPLSLHISILHTAIVFVSLNFVVQNVYSVGK